MPASETVAKEQVERFADYDGFPENAAGMRDFIQAFTSCYDDAHATKTGDRLVATYRKCPKPVDVTEAANGILAEIAQEEIVEWKPVRRPDDEEFQGIEDLIDERVMSYLQQKAQTGRTYAEREAARKLLVMKPGVVVGDRQGRVLTDDELRPLAAMISDNEAKQLREKIAQSKSEVERRNTERLLLLRYVPAENGAKPS